jgi:hypothetical protein
MLISKWSACQFWITVPSTPLISCNTKLTCETTIFFFTGPLGGGGALVVRLLATKGNTNRINGRASIAWTEFEYAVSLFERFKLSRLHPICGRTRDRTSELKAVPLQGWCGPEGSRKLRFPDYMTMAQDDGKVVSLTHRPPLPPGNAPGTRFC